MAIGWTCLCLLALHQIAVGVRYDPTWESIDSRPLPQWYDEAKLGIFISWGLFAVPSIYSEWFWYQWLHFKNPEIVNYMKNYYRPDFTYADFAPQFTAEFYDPNQWTDMFKASGAEYVVFISKHHEGYTNWPSNHSFNWNSMAVGPKRDLVGELAKAIRQNSSIHFGLYHSLFEWYNPTYLQDKENNFSTQNFVNDKTMPELYELINTYKPDVIWSDGEWEASSDYWESKQFLAWLYNDSPVKDTVVTNDRWGSDATCHHGGYLTCKDRYQPGVLQKRKWENAMTIDRNSWGFRRNAVLIEYLPTDQLIETFVETVSCGGNMLMNVGPTKEGFIDPIYETRLRDVGSWLNVNGEAIKSSKPWTSQNDTVTPRVWYTMKNSDVYAILLDWPTSSTLSLGAPKPQTGTEVSLLGYNGGNFTWKSRQGGGIEIMIPAIPANQMPCQWACGGNMLMNVGPTKEGFIDPIYETRLRDVGSWLNVNGEAIKSSKPWTSQNDTVTPRVWYTMKNSDVYAILLDWPTSSTLSLGAPKPQTGTEVSLLGYNGGNFTWKSRQGGGIEIMIPAIPANQMPCQWAWVFKLSGLSMA